MLHSIVQVFATLGGGFVSICIIAAGIAATSFSTGVFAEQFAPNVFKASVDRSVTNGLKTGAIIGVFWSIASIYELGNWGAVLSILGLCASLLILAGLTCLIADWSRPYDPNFD
jgi:hypothetical protein